MRDPETIATTPPVELRFRRRVGIGHSAVELWHHREIVISLADRDFRARYKQAVLGVGWAILQPMILMLIFTFTIRRFTHVQTHGVPYPLFAYVGLIAWNFFSGSVGWSVNCLVGNQPILNKVRFPREACPTASVLLATIDATVSMIGLVAFFAIYRFTPPATIVWVPLFAVLLWAVALAVSILVSILVVYLRDLKQIVPVVLQMALFATPVAYEITDNLRPRLQPIYCAVNPVAPFIDGLRSVVLYGTAPQWPHVAIGAASTAVLLFGGLRIFKRLEVGIADLI
jgi:ABC-type polysaccharide/polyol phosphate export permease